MTLMEAMLCGRPAIVTDVGGNAEWIKEGHNGFIAPAATPLSFGDAMERAWAAKERGRELGNRAHDDAMLLFDPHAGQTILKLLIDIASAKK